MDPAHQVLTPRDLTSIQHLQFFAKREVEGYCTGLHSSPHKGYSVEFKQHRPYSQGDDIRRIDWKVYSRSDRYYIREYEEETNLRCTLLVDASGSMKYEGSSGQVKFEYARRLAACFAHLMMRQQDAVGLITFDTKPRDFLPARSRRSHLAALMEVLGKTEVGGETDLAVSLSQVVPRIQSRGLVILISDCFTEVEPMMKSLAQLRHRGHEVLVFQIWDRDELEFPFKQWTRFVNLENAELLKEVDPAVIRRSYLNRMEIFRKELKQACRKNRVEIVEVVTDEPYADALGKFLAKRMRI